MNKDKLKEIFKEAAEIVSKVPENMQPVAFSRAIDILLGEEPDTKTPIKKRRKKAPSSKKTKEKIEDTSVQRILDELDRTKHPIVNDLSDVLDRSLLVLKIAKDEFDIDGFTPPQIAKILTEIFRLPTSRQAVYNRLSKAVKLVDSKSVGKANIYRIMQPGEKYLAKIIEKKEKKEKKEKR